VIRTNLSTRPFYNERVVHLALILLAVLVVAASLYNVSRILRYSSSDTRLATQASRDEARSADLRQQAARLRASVDPQQVELASVGARQANDLIDRRTFSWTELLNRFEATLSDQARITSIQPRVDRDKGILLRVMVIARGVQDVDDFMENLEATGAFTNATSAEDHFDEDGLLVSTLEMGYVPDAVRETTPAGGANPAAEQPAADTPAAQPEPPPTATPGRGGAAQEAPAPPPAGGTQPDPPPTTRPGRGGPEAPAPAPRPGRGRASR
jgi:Tfp pilus assembly protein PilN